MILVIWCTIRESNIDIEIIENRGKYVVSLFIKTVSKETKGFNKVLNSFEIFDIDSEVMDTHLADVVLVYDGPDKVV
jgi:hypothetical protein